MCTKRSEVHTELAIFAKSITGGIASSAYFAMRNAERAPTWAPTGDEGAGILVNS